MSIQQRMQAGLASGNLSSESLKAPPQEEAVEEVPEVDQPRLSPEDLRAMDKMKILMEYEAAETRNDARALEHAKKALERDEQLEARLKPLELTELLFNDSLTQVVPVSEQLRLQFRTVPAHTALLYRAAVSQYIKDRGLDESALRDADRSFIEALASLSAGLLSVNDIATNAESIHQATDNSEATRALVEQMRFWSKKPTVLIEQLVHHQRMFIVRVRRVLEHAGYLEQEAKKS